MQQKKQFFPLLSCILGKLKIKSNLSRKLLIFILHKLYNEYKISK
jgi:hypothetical protein